MNTVPSLFSNVPEVNVKELEKPEAASAADMTMTFYRIDTTWSLKELYRIICTKIGEICPLWQKNSETSQRNSVHFTFHENAFKHVFELTRLEEDGRTFFLLVYQITCTA